MSEPMPKIEYAPAPCPGCGARTFKEAETMCRPTSDETGERSCAGTDCPEPAPNDLLMFPTAASLAALDAWCDRNADDPALSS